MRSGLHGIALIATMATALVILTSPLGSQQAGLPGGVGTQQVCHPDVNPECGGGGGGCSGGTCSCSTGTVISTTRSCWLCATDPTTGQQYQAGQWFTTRECCTNYCPCPTITCWSSRGCGMC